MADDIDIDKATKKRNKATPDPQYSPPSINEPPGSDVEPFTQSEPAQTPPQPQ